MLFKSNTVPWGLALVLGTVDLARWAWSKAVASPLPAAKASNDGAPLRLVATIELIEAPEPPDGGAPMALPLPVLAQTAALATMYRASIPRPLACQMAYTASRNVPKGRKPRAQAQKQGKIPAPSLKSARLAGAVKAKPAVAVIAKKKSAKRRHVWLSNQSRAIRTVTSNVVQLSTAAKIHRAPGRAVVAKSGTRHLRLAA